ncbi:MAG: PA domain-containing protein [Saprospiraceae bacterium]
MKKLFTFIFSVLYFFTIAQVNPGLKLNVNGKSYATSSAAFGPVLDAGTSLCEALIVIDSKGGATPTVDTKLEGCDQINNAAAINGKIALIKRGTCLFVEKVLNAQKSGAIAVIIFNNISEPLPTSLGGTDSLDQIKIPSCRISLEDGNELLALAKAGTTMNACFFNPNVAISAAYGNRDANVAPLSQTDSVFTLLSLANKGTEDLKDITVFADIISPSGVKSTVRSETADIPPTATGFVELIELPGYKPTEKGTHRVRFYGNYSADTTNTTFVLSDNTFAHDNGTIPGTGTARTSARFATEGKKYTTLNFYKTGSKACKATYATFGIINAKAMKNRSFKVTVWETSASKLSAIASSTNSPDLIAEYPVGDDAIYKMAGTEKNLVTVPLKDGNKDGINLEANKMYILTVEYDGTSFSDSIVPQYTLGKVNPVRWKGFSVSGTAVMSGTTYFGGGWSATDDPIGRLHIDNFVGNEELTPLAENEVSIFPNPVINTVQVKLDLQNASNKVQLGIMDELGRILQVQDLNDQHGIFSVNMSSYPPGTYFFTVKTDKSFSTEKIIKE